MIQQILQLRKIFFVASLSLVCLGVLSFLQLPRQEDPKIKYNMVRVVIPYPGADPYKVEKVVTKEVEKSVLEIDSVEEVLAVSKNSLSALEVVFDYDSDLDNAIEKLKDKIDELAPTFPQEVAPAIIFDELVKNYSFIVMLQGEQASLMELEEKLETLKKQCLGLSGVAQVELRGDVEEAIFVSLDLEKLSKFRVPISRIIEALQARNDIKPAGVIKAAGQDFLIETQGEFTSTQEIENVIIDISPNDTPIYLADVAKVRPHWKDLQYKVRHNGQEAVALVVIMKEGYNIFQFQEQMHKLMDNFRAALPSSMTLTVQTDQAYYVDRKLSHLYSNLLQGMLCVAIVLLLFIGPRESTLVSLAIPVTFAISMFFLGIFGVALQQMSIASLVISLGLLVDNSIVVVENIHKEMATSSRPWTEIFAHATRTIAPSIISGTLTTIAAFIPLAFMVGATGAFIRSIPIVVITTLACSLFVALVFIPILYFWAVPKKEHAQHNDPTVSPLLKKYQNFIRLLLKRRYAVAIVGVTFVVICFWLASQMRMELFSKAHRPQLMTSVYLREGANLNKTESIAQAIEQKLLAKEDFPEITSVSCFLGNGAPKFYYNEVGDWKLNDPAYMEIVINLDPNVPNARSPREVVYAAQQSLDLIPGAQIRVRQLQHGKPFQAPITLRISGDNLTGIQEITDKLSTTLEKIPGTRNVLDNLGEDTYKLKAVIDPFRLNQVRAIHQDISADIYTAFNGQVATNFLSGEEKIDVVVRLEESDRESLANIEKLYFSSRFTNKKIPFRQVASLEMDLERAQLNRYNQRWYSSVTSDTQNRLPSEIISELKKQVATWQLPPGYKIEFEGEDKELQKSIGVLTIAGTFALILIYLILSFEFNSLFQPLIIMTIVPMAIAGSIFGLYLLGIPLGFMSLMGFVSLAGIVVNDAIIVVDGANAQMRGEKSLIASYESYSHILANTAKERLKPILATSITTIVSLLPLALWGGPFWEPFAWTVIFGLITSTFLTLIYTPITFRLIEDIKLKLGFLPPFRIFFVTKDSKLKKKVSRLLSHSHFLYFSQDTLPSHLDPEFLCIDQADFSATEVAQLLRSHASTPHVITILLSEKPYNAQSFKQYLQEQEVELTRLLDHLLQGVIYLEKQQAQQIPRIIKENSQKMQSIVQSIWQLSRQRH